MSLRPIVKFGDPVLRTPGARVDGFGPSLHRLLDDMRETMLDAPGVGLAAQQIGLALQVAVIEVDERCWELINPRIVRVAGEQRPVEGCLSLPGHWAPITRPAKVSVVAQDRHGKQYRLTGTGLLAEALEHEIDHLQGRLFIDRLDSHADLFAPDPEEREERRAARARVRAAS